MAASDPSDIQLVAPALLQLNKGGGGAVQQQQPYSSCPSPACGAQITTFPDCAECRDCTDTDLNLQCDTCWTDCASPCNDDDCHIPQPCYEDHCAVDSCIDSTCAVETCTDVTCPETVHCNATCFDTTCLYNFGDDFADIDAQACGQSNCFGFLPAGPGLNGFGMNDMSYQCPQASTTHAPHTHNWENLHLQFPDHQYLPHAHDGGNRHKRRKTMPQNPYPAFDQQSEPWSDDQLDALFSPQTLNTPMSLGQEFPGTFDFTCDDSCHHSFKHIDPFAADIASSLPCGPNTDDTSTTKAKKKSTKPARLLPAPNNGMHPPSFSSLRSTQQSPTATEAEHVCQWVTSSGVCGHAFTSAKDLDDHLQSAHTSKLGPQAFTCHWDGCETEFKHRGKLNRHISGAHSKYHAYVCSHTDPTTGEKCTRTFCTKEQLKNHETTHTGERKYKCRFCDHTSATKTQHNTHERIHTKEKPYLCPFPGCGHRSGDSSNLSKHVRNRHPGFKVGGVEGKRKSMSVEAPGLMAG